MKKDFSYYNKRIELKENILTFVFLIDCLICISFFFAFIFTGRWITLCSIPFMIILFTVVIYVIDRLFSIRDSEGHVYARIIKGYKIGTGPYVYFDSIVIILKDLGDGRSKVQLQDGTQGIVPNDCINQLGLSGRSRK